MARILSPTTISSSLDSGINDDISNTNQLTLIGTGFANTVEIFDAETLLAATTVDGSGEWSFATASLSSRIETFTAVNADASGNTNSPSNALSVSSNVQGPVNFSSILTTNNTSLVSSASSSAAIGTDFFGFNIHAAGYNFPPVDAWPTIPFSIERSLAVWSPGDGTIPNPGHGCLLWAFLNPSPGVYNWAPLDSWIAECKAHGVEMDYVLGTPPAWAGGTNPDPAALQTFITALVTHCAGQIKYFEGFNEFDNELTASIPQLVALQQVLYQTAKQIDPSCIVVSPTSDANSAVNMGPFLQAGGANWFDVLAMHSYVTDTADIIQEINSYQSAMTTAAIGAKPMWITEWAWSPSVTDPNAQAAFVSQGLILEHALGIQKELFYAYDQQSATGWGGLYDPSTGQLDPAGVAMGETTQWLLGATMPNGYQVNGSVYSVQLQKFGQNELIVWNDGASTSYSAGSYTEYVDLQGQVHAITNGTVMISSAPILLEAPTQALVVTRIEYPVDLSSVVTVTGTPTLTLNDGSTATYAGAGNVTFCYHASTDSTPTSHDIITDFVHGQDKIDFTNIAGMSARHGIPAFQGQLSGSGNLILNAQSVAYMEVSGNTDILVNTTQHPESVSTSNVTAANMEIVLMGVGLHLTAQDFHYSTLGSSLFAAFNWISYI